MDKIQTLSADFLLNQAKMTATDYMLHAATTMQLRIGDDAFEKFPEIAAAIIAAAAQDFNTAILAQRLELLAESIQRATDTFCRAQEL